MFLFTTIALIALAAYALGFHFYGRFVTRAFGVSDKNTTPAVKINDGQDFVPTRSTLLLGQHFSAIAAVGPIAGPILAGLQYGWLAGVFWIVIGAILVGGVHDFAALIASVRHNARSIGDLMRDYLGTRAAAVFSLFIWFSLLYVIVVFTDLTAAAFVNRPELGAQNFGPGVATSSLLYLGLALIMGVVLARTRVPLWAVTTVFVPLIFLAIAVGQKFPIIFSGTPLEQQKIWDGIILVYCFFAAILPLWLLLQPRGYLGGFILYTTFIVGIAGILFGGMPVRYPAIKEAIGLGGTPMGLFPLLFTTIACGACSGFHGLVASGTTSKQLARESDAKRVGFGGMLLESLLAVIAMATLMMVAPGSSELGLGPDEIYARGLAHFMEVVGIPFAAGVTFGKLAFATFIYDTLDVSTRLGRYVLEELLGLKGRIGAVLATFMTLAVPAVTILATFRDAAGNVIPLWKIFWPAFGASNQLLAALTLASVTVWLKREGRNFWVTGIPAILMTLVSVSSLVTLIRFRIAAGQAWKDPVAWTGVILLILAAGYLSRVAATLFHLFSDGKKPSHRRADLA